MKDIHTRLRQSQSLQREDGDAKVRMKMQTGERRCKRKDGDAKKRMETDASAEQPVNNEGGRH